MEGNRTEPRQIDQAHDYEAKRNYQHRSFARSYERRRFGSLAGRLFSFFEVRTIGRAIGLLTPRGRVLDLPCGTGRISRHLLDRGFRVCGGDISQSMLDVAKEQLSGYPSLEWLRVIDAEAIDARDGEFDHAVCIKFMHLVAPEVRIAVLKELARVTTGSIVVSYACDAFGGFSRAVKQIAGRRDAISEHAVRKADLDLELAAAGLTIVRRFWAMPLLSAEAILVVGKQGA